MLKQIALAVCLTLSMGVSANPEIEVTKSNMTDILEYAKRTAKDYCSPANVDCILEFSNQVMSSYKDGQMDARSRYREKALSERYENRLMTTECIPSDAQFKDVCTSMVDRLVDAYNRGLNAK